jgi:hypothetical protein
MWPFSKKQAFPGVTQREDGTIEFTLTDDEVEAINCTMSNFDDVLIHPDAVERISQGTTAVALSRYAKDLVNLHSSPQTKEEYRRDWPVIEIDLRKAVAAVWKSYGMCQLPIYVYHRALYLKMLGTHHESSRLFALFLKKQNEFKPDAIDEVLINFEGTNIDHALANARNNGLALPSPPIRAGDSTPKSS